jgi:hypothetical protein
MNEMPREETRVAKPDYDTSVARIAGNIASGMMDHYLPDGAVDDRSVVIAMQHIAKIAVAQARAIVNELKRTP